jgi:apolipoprotein D and lipocalin family protein
MRRVASRQSGDIPGIVPPATSFYYYPSRPSIAPTALPESEQLPQLDLARYSGTWYEAARTPNPFEAGCLASKAEYDYDERTDTLSVVNSCSLPGGNMVEIRGVARPVGPGRLYVTFDTPAHPSRDDAVRRCEARERDEGNYWVLEIDSCYSLALVGSPCTRYGWVLSRTPRPDPTAVRDAFDRLVRVYGFSSPPLADGGKIRPKTPAAA